MRLSAEPDPLGFRRGWSGPDIGRDVSLFEKKQENPDEKPRPSPSAGRMAGYDPFASRKYVVVASAR